MPPHDPGAGSPTWRLDVLLHQHADLLDLVDRAQVLREVARRVREVSGADVGLVAEVEGRELVGRSACGLRDGLPAVRVGPDAGLGGQVLRTGAPRCVADYAADPAISHELDPLVRAERVRAVAAVPVVIDERVAGVVYAGARRPDAFGPAAVEELQRIAGTAAVALRSCDRARALAEVAVQEERHQMATALHDSVGAMLFGIGAAVRDLREHYRCTPAMLQRLGQIEEQVAETASTLRRSIATLRDSPPHLALEVALHEDCRAFAERTGVAAEAIVLGGLPDLDPGRAQALQGAVREGLLNVEKHARARSVLVTVAMSDDGVVAAVADDGCGRPPAPRPGFGLDTVAERLSRVGGRLSLVDNEDAGTTLRAWVPCL